MTQTATHTPGPKLVPGTESTADALFLLEDVSARARHMGLGMVSYPVETVEAVCAALRAVRAQPVADAEYAPDEIMAIRAVMAGKTLTPRALDRLIERGLLSDCLEVTDAARAAIAKAEGQTP